MGDFNDKDQLSRFTLEGTDVRGEWLHLDESWQTILTRHEYPDVVRRVLGEALAAVTLLSSVIKYQGSLILQIKAEGPIHLLVVQATSEGTVRGLARWRDVLPAPGANLQSLFGQGNIVITVQPNNGSKPYQGIVSMEGNTMQECLQGYFEQSEQLDTRLWLAADEHRCAGLLLQRLPGEEDDGDGWERATQLAETLQSHELLGEAREALLHKLYHQESVKLYPADMIRFRCGCSQQRIESVIQSMGREDADAIIEEQGKIQVDCEFCNSHYEFGKAEIEQLFASVPSSETRH